MTGRIREPGTYKIISPSGEVTRIEAHDAVQSGTFIILKRIFSETIGPQEIAWVPPPFIVVLEP